MGQYDIACALSGLPLRTSTALLLTTDGVPVAAPLFGSYDSYGSIDLAAVPSVTAEALWPTQAAEDGPADAEARAHGSFLIGGRWVGYGEDALVLLLNADIYRAVAATVLASADPRWRDHRREVLEALPTNSLFAAALPEPESQRLYAGLSDEQWRRFRPDLIELLAFRQWPGAIEQRPCADQYYSHADLSRAEEITRGWHAYPQLGAIVDAVAAEWLRTDGKSAG